MEGTPEEDAAAKAFRAISSHINEWASPLVGTVDLAPRYYDDEEEDFMEEEEDDVMDWTNRLSSPTAAAATFTPQKRGNNGTETPVMSNSRKQQRQPSPLELAETVTTPEAETDIEPVEVVGVQTPWQHPPALRPTTATTRGDDHYEYRRYHDALLTYCTARRNVVKRLELQQEQASIMVDPVDVTLVSDETRVDRDFLQALSAVCLDSSAENDMREGNFWALLVKLRSLGLPSLLFADDTAHQAEYQQEIEKITSELALEIHKSPMVLLEDLEYRATMVLSRRKLILEWLQQCQSFLLSQVAMPSKSQSTMWSASLSRLEQGSKKLAEKVDTLHPDAPLLVREACQPSFSVTPIDPLYDNDEKDDVTLLRACFSLLLAGQLDKAVELCRACGQPWRAAAWTGGIPHGVRSTPNLNTEAMDRTEQGNLNRALWKRNCWNLSGILSNKMTSTGSSVQYEAVIYALLSDDTTSALSSPVVTTWEQRMQIMFGAVLGRIEDSLLYRCNNNRRKIGKRFPFPGTEYEEEEREQLQRNASLANMTEASICATVASYSSEANNAYLSAQAAFISGKSAVANYLAKEEMQLDENTDVTKLRFLTHLTIYLDSIEHSTNHIEVEGLERVKNKVLLEYVRFLATRSDLWRMLALYASMLPVETLLDCYPEFLCRVHGDAERRGMLKDTRQYFETGQDLVILKRVVAMHLSNDSDGPRAAPLRKIKAVLWLTHYDEHFGDALVFANTLLRQFLLEPAMMQSALLFVSEYFPAKVAQTVVEQIAYKQASTEKAKDQSDLAVYENAVAEHGALECYLQAYNTFENWQNVVGNTPFGAANADLHNFPGLSGKEQEIARSMERRDVIRCKRQSGQAVVQAAEQARGKMLEVLEYEGGFLQVNQDRMDNDDRQRLDELASLRRLCLPQVVFWLHKVCDGTADWMQGFLKDGLPKLGKSSSDVVSALDSNAATEASPLTPSYWLDRCLDLANTVASDESGIHDTFEIDDMKKFLSLMAETTVKQLHYNTVKK